MLMTVWFFWFFISLVNAAHFNGGTIRWFPTDPYGNGESVSITITQSYYWSHPYIECTQDVPIQTVGRSGDNANLTCVAECSDAGGYENNPVDILTDCMYVSSAMGFMFSERSVNITLNPEAYFYLGHVGSGWQGINQSEQTGVQWSMITLINLEPREDGSINIPPSVNVVSPQYIIVNSTTDIRIPVSDSNEGDDVRCRWSTYTPGYRRRKRSKRASQTCTGCASSCLKDCSCTCPSCQSTTCTESTCKTSTCPTILTTTAKATIDTRGTLRSTSSYPNARAIDECGDICYPKQLPADTTLSDCTLSIQGLAADTWYAVAIQVEDFLDKNSESPMSSVPVQFLIYVMPAPYCTQLPKILAVEDCLEVQIGVSKAFNISVFNYCDGETASIQEMIVSKSVAGLEAGDLTVSSENSSVTYTTYKWVPQESQLGFQQICFIAYTTEKAQSVEYCVAFDVKNSSSLCMTTETTTTTTVSLSSGSTRPFANITSVTSSTGTKVPSTTAGSSKNFSWGLIAGLISLILPLGLFSTLCIYQLLKTPETQQQIQMEDVLGAQEREQKCDNDFSSMEKRTTVRNETSGATSSTNPIAVPNKTYQVYDIHANQNHRPDQFYKTATNSLTLMEAPNVQPMNQESSLTLSNASFDMTQSNLSQWSASNVSSTEQPLINNHNRNEFTKSARRYLYGFSNKNISQS